MITHCILRISLFQIVSVCSWLLLGLMFLGIIFVFDPNGSVRSNSASHRVADVERGEPQPLYINLNSSNMEKAKKVWEWQYVLNHGDFYFFSLLT